MNFREFVKLMEDNASSSWRPLGMVIPPPVFGALPTQWTGSQPSDMPIANGGYGGSDWIAGQMDLGLPNVEKSGIIKILKRGQNPILVGLQDAQGHLHRIDIPENIFRRIQPEPTIDRTMVVVFGRRPEDTSEAPTKIISIRCF